MKVPIARTSLTEIEVESIMEPLRSGWLVQGPKVKEFESKWSAFTRSSNSIATTSCTSALHLALAALGVGPGDEVIVPAFTWISTANVVEHLRAKVVFVDIDIQTFNMDPSKLEEKITPRTKAVMPVHLFGLSADMDPIMAIAHKYDLSVVEDAACGFGTTYREAHVGTIGTAGCFSFHPRKAITTGEGGMLTTADDELATKIRRLRDHGAATSDLQRHVGETPFALPHFPDAGYNQRMTDLQGALGSTQMNRADDILRERRMLAARYDEAFSDLDWLETPHSQDGFGHSYQSYACLYQPERVHSALETQNKSEILDINAQRNEWMVSLQESGISSRPATHAVHMLGYYTTKYKTKPEDFFRAFAADQCSVSLPLFHGMTQAEQDHVIASVRAAGN